jgi:universal stress protein F
MFRRVLLPIDLTEPEMAEQALDEARTLAIAFNGELRLVNVQSLIPIDFLDYVPEDFDGQIREGIEKEIAAIADKIKYPPERISTTVLFGPVHHKILAEAEAWGSDLIVLCSHRPGMDRFLIGSHASAIVQHAKCSVLVLRRTAS